MAGEHGKTEVGFWLGGQDAKEEWMIDHKGDWGWRRWTDNGAFHTELESLEGYRNRRIADVHEASSSEPSSPHHPE